MLFRSIDNVVTWENENNVKIIKEYEYSDNIPEGNIISQSINPNTVLKDIKELTVVISNGPNYDKFVVLSNMVGRNIEDVRKFLKENHFNNTTLNFVGNN